MHTDRLCQVTDEGLKNSRTSAVAVPSTITRSAASSSTTPRSKSSDSLGVVRFSTAFVEVVRVSAIDTCLTMNAPVSKTPPKGSHRLAISRDGRLIVILHIVNEKP